MVQNRTMASCPKLLCMVHLSTHCLCCLPFHCILLSSIFCCFVIWKSWIHLYDTFIREHSIFMNISKSITSLRSAVQLALCLLLLFVLQLLLTMFFCQIQICDIRYYYWYSISLLLLLRWKFMKTSVWIWRN